MGLESTSDVKGAGDGEIVEVPYLIVGLGPAGGGLACFLAQNGLKGLAISSANSTADTPRAHVTNTATLECLRDIDLEEDVKRLGNGGPVMMHTRLCYSMTGEEFARSYAQGRDPRRKGEYVFATPCENIDLPQTKMEPLLLRYATWNGFEARFNTEFVGFTEESSGMIVSDLFDKTRNHIYKVRSKYLFAADGAKSLIVKELGLPLSAKPTDAVAINVVVKVDLSQYMRNRQGNLHMIMQADQEHPDFGSISVARMIKPWYEWMFILYPQGGFDVRPTNEEYIKHIKNLIGNQDLDVELLSVSKWNVNEIVAEKYSHGNIHCLGDAVHRHPPNNGLGSNTCIQDAYNLAWKVAFVEKGFADPSLLDTFSIERQPVGSRVIVRANRGFHGWQAVWDFMKLDTDDIATRKAVLDQMRAPGPEGDKARHKFQKLIDNFHLEFQALGVEVDQRYDHSPAVIRDAGNDEDVTADQDPHGPSRVLYYTPSTIPGRRLPHAWLNKAVPVDPISTQDLAGKAAFCVFTGHGGEAWKAAAAKVTKKLGVPINAYGIGFRLDWEDVYLDWARLRGVNDSGCVLVRPDRFCAWRCTDVAGDEDQCTEQLTKAIRSVLCYKS